jgi:hypothetical protein
MATQKRMLMAKSVDMDILSLEALSEEFERAIHAHSECLAQLDNWASARDVQTLSKSILNRAIQNLEQIKRGQLPISEEMINSECIRDGGCTSCQGIYSSGSFIGN